MKLTRFSGNPILSPHPEHPWEDLAVFNPAAWYDEERKEVLLLYRTAESHPDYKCYFGLATSKDGYHFERVGDQPVLSPSVEGFDGATIQDPRLIKMGEWYYVTYAARHYPFGQFWIPEVKQRYATPDCPPEFPKYLRTNATLTGPGDDEGFSHLDSRRLADEPTARRSRRDFVSRESAGEIRDAAPAAGMVRREIWHGASLRRGSRWPTI